jgi:hypothetical protein
MGVHCHAELPHDATAAVEAACDAGASSTVFDAVPDPSMFTTSCVDRALSIPEPATVASSIS